MACQNKDDFLNMILYFDQNTEIDTELDKDLRYNVWETTSKILRELTQSKDIDSLPNKDQSGHIRTKIANALKRVTESTKTGGTIQEDIFNDEHNVEMSIALHEVMESVKGEADKARNNSVEVIKISGDGVLPALPLSRIAASIGRKIAFQKGYRFKKAITSDDAVTIEKIYYVIGKTAIEGLQEKGYLKINSDVSTIQDYIDSSELKKEFPKVDILNHTALSVTLEEGKLGIEPGSEEANYFLNRTAADLDNTDLGVATDMLRVASQITQPATFVLPDIKKSKNRQELAQNDSGIAKIDPVTEAVRQGIYEKPTFVHETLHQLMTLLNEATLETGVSASKIIMKQFKDAPNLTRDLFGLKRSDDFSIDKKESVGGQNLSKTTPMDDIAEYYKFLVDLDGKPAPLHMVMKLGKNARLYYENSILNPHASKQSRYMLTPGAYEVQIGSDDFKFLVYGISQALGDPNITYDEFKNFTKKGSKLERVLDLLEDYEQSDDLEIKLAKISHMSKEFPGVDYVTLLTAVKAIKDIKTPVPGTKSQIVSTQFTVAVDATASGGTITFLQALGTNTNIELFLSRTGMMKDENGNVIAADDDNKLDDLYGLMSEAIEEFVSPESKTDTNTTASDDDKGSIKLLLQDTLDQLFNAGDDIRELSKDPTMVFVYGQGKTGAIKTLANSLANRIVDNLDNPKTRQYLSRLLKDSKYRNLEGSVLRNEEGLHAKIVKELTDQGLPGQLYDLMGTAINKKFLKEYKKRSSDVWEFVKKLPTNNPMKTMPAGAILSDKLASDRVIRRDKDGNKIDEVDALEEYGQPLTKTFEVSHQIEGTSDRVLTRKEKPTKTVGDVSTTHGFDAAQIYHAENKVTTEQGGIFTHDEKRGTVKDVRAFTTAYADVTLEILGKYDTHQQIMKAIAVRSPEIAATPAFQKLKEKIDGDVEAKKKIIEARFNSETDALIGDGNDFLDFADKKGKFAKAEGDPEGSQPSQIPAPPEDAGGASAETVSTSPFADLKELGRPGDRVADNRAKGTNNQSAESGGLFAADEEITPELREELQGLLAEVEDSVTPEQQAEFDNVVRKQISRFLNKVAPESPLLTRFMQRADIATPTSGFIEPEEGDTESRANLILGDPDDKDAFRPGLDLVTISGTDPRQVGKPDLDLDKAEDLAAQVEIVDHEIIHAYTLPYLAKVLNQNRIPSSKQTRTENQARLNVAYVQNAMHILIDMEYSGKTKFSEKAQKRMNYILGQRNEFNALNEFMAIMGGEPDTANEFYNALAKRIPEKTLRDRLAQIFASIRQAFMELTTADFRKEVDAEKLQSAILNVIVSGVNFREQQSEEFHDHLNSGLDEFNIAASTKKKAKPSVKIPDPDEIRMATLQYVNSAVAMMVTSRLESQGVKLIGKLHINMQRVFPLYSDAVNKARGIYDGSEALQQFLHTVTGEGVNKNKKATILAQYAKIAADQSEQINQQLGKFHTLLTPLEDKDKKTIGRFVTQLPLHDYFVHASEITTGAEIDAEVIRLEERVKKITRNAVSDIDSLIDRNVHGKEGEGIYNLEAKYPRGDASKNGVDIRKLLALKSIQAIGTKDFEKFLANTDLVNLIKDHVIANRLSLLENNGTENLRDSLVMDHYKEPHNKLAIELKDLPMYENGEETGWVILERPTKDTLGVVYRPIVDSTTIIGAYTDIKLESTDINVVGKQKEYSNVVETENGYKLVLTEKNKKELGITEDFSEALVRGTAHSMAIKESQIIRDTLLKQETRMVLDSPTKAGKLIDILKSDNFDNPWFIKLGEGQKYGELAPEIRAVYKKVADRASDVKGFNEEVDLVRKDISHWLLGGSATSLFQNKQMKWMVRIVKDAVAGAKIGMVVLNPIKIAKDNISNVSYLGVSGVSPPFIAKNYREISRDFYEYRELQAQIIQLKVQLTARPESTKIKQKIKSLEKRVKHNSVGDLAEKGFINSLGSDLVSRSADTSSGLQADMHTALEYLLINKKGNRNLVSHFLGEIQNLGFNGEDFLTYIGGIVGRSKDGKGAENRLDQVAERLKEIRTENDIVNYVAQYTNSPASELVRLGSSMTDLTDVLAKETLYRHLTQNEGMDPEAAKIRVLDSFPDYKENLPLAIKQLSDVGIIMFPSFWLRIQKVIYRIARDKPINLAAELMLEEALDSDVETIFQSNIINKANTFGGLLHTPLEPIGVGSFVPTHFF